MDTDHSPAPFDFNAHKRAAVEQYQDVRPLYDSFARVVESILEKALRNANIKVASIEARAKELTSFADKAVTPAEEDPNQPKYSSPLTQITDLAGVRVITFFLSTIKEVDQIIAEQFTITEKADKSVLLLQEEKLGYQSVHYIVELKDNRTTLPEYVNFSNLKAEIQLRTVLQHAWAEIEHDIQYKSIETIPAEIRNRFMALAGVLQIADREFQAIQKEDEELRHAARVSVQQGRLEQVEITGDALKAYLDGKFGPDGRMANWSYEYTARLLKRLGFQNFQQIEDCIGPYNDDQLSRAIYGTRQGQLTRFEDMVFAALGERYLERHSFASDTGWRTWKNGYFEKMKQLGVTVGRYDPLDENYTVA